MRLATKSPPTKRYAKEIAPKAKPDSFIPGEISTVEGLWWGRISRYNPDDLVGKKGLQIYEKMLRDEQVKAALHAKMMAVISSGHEVLPPEVPEGDKEMADETADFTEFNFQEMEGALNDKLLEMMMAMPYGFCLHGDTAIHTPSGDKPIRELVGLQPWVFSKVAGGLKLVKAARVWMSKRDARCVKVSYEWRAHGEMKRDFIICTREHPFQLLDGNYMRAGDLQSGAKLAPFSQKISMPGPNPYKRKRAYVKTGPRWDEWKRRSHWVWEELHGKINRSHVHHKDGDTLNDDPENLELMDGSEHTRYHTLAWLHNATPEQLQRRSIKLKKYNSDPLHKQIRSTISSSANILQWRDPEIRARRIAGMTGKKRSEQALENVRRACQDPERRRKISEAQKTRWLSIKKPPKLPTLPYTKERRAEISHNLWNDESFASRAKSGMSRAWTPERRAELAQRNRTRAKLNLRDSINHRVVSVEAWGVADVYDIEVPETRNFAANHVFVHNSVGEKVLHLIDYGKYDGKVGLKALKFRKPWSIDFEADTYGNLLPDGILQAEKRLPTNKFVLCTYRKTWDNPYGDSDLRSVFRAWWSKDVILKYMAIALERFGEPITDIKHTGTLTPTQRADLRAFSRDLQSRSALIHSDAVTLDFHYPSPRTSEAFIPAIKLYDSHISRGILMPALLGMSGEESTGSLARSGTEFDVFLWVIGYLREWIEAVVNEQIVKPLIDLNYEVTGGMYPAFRFKAITEEVKYRLFQIYLQGIAGQGLTKTQDDEIKFREMLDLPPLPEQEEMPPEGGLPGEELPPELAGFFAKKYGTPEFDEMQTKLVEIVEPLREKWYAKVEAGEMEFKDAQVAALEEAWEQYKMAA